MNRAAFFALGLGVGVVASYFLIRSSTSDARVAAGVRARVGAELGTTAQAVGDLFGVWKFTPGALDLFGVPT